MICLGDLVVWFHAGYFDGGCSSMAELQIVVLDVAGSSPVSHPLPREAQLPGSAGIRIHFFWRCSYVPFLRFICHALSRKSNFDSHHEVATQST